MDRESFRLYGSVDFRDIRGVALLEPRFRADELYVHGQAHADPPQLKLRFERRTSSAPGKAHGAITTAIARSKFIASKATLFTAL